MRATIVPESADAAPRRAVDLVETSLSRIEQLDDRYHAFCYVDPERARADARRLDENERAGRPPGPLHGVPLAVKDVIDVAGYPTRAGSEVLDHRVAGASAPAVERLTDAGAVVVGKTTTDELAMGVRGLPARNPFDPGRLPGGSSSGSAVAVALDMAMAGLGTDTAGSLRIPAAFCGVFSLKPRRAAVPMEGIVPLAPSLDSCGPFAASLDDLELLWAILSGRQAPAPRRPFVIGIPREPGDLHPAVEERFAGAVKRLSSGATVAAIDLPAWGAWDPARGLATLVEALEVHRSRGWYPDRAGLYGAHVLRQLRRAEELSQEERAWASKEVAALTELFSDAAAAVDGVLLPTVPVPAPKVDDSLRGIDAALMRYCAPVNLAGLAAVNLPVDAGGEGSLGLQVVGRDEETVLAIARLIT